MASRDFLFVIINALLYIYVLRKHWKTTHKMDCGFLILTAYCATAIMCVVNYYINSDRFDLHLLPFVFLFVVLMIFFIPYLKNTDNLANRILIPNLKILDFFSYFYIACAIFSVVLSWNDMKAAFEAEEWNDVIGKVFEEGVVLYHSNFERFCKNICSYTQVLALIMAFHYYTKNRYRPIMGFMLFVSAIMSMATTTVIAASRGAFAGMFIKLLAGFVLFLPLFKHKAKTFLVRGGLAILAIFLIYTISVTYSRFADITYDTAFDDPTSSLIYYFGHSMLRFNDGLMDSIQQFMWGDYFLGIRDGYQYGIDAVLGTHCNGAFYTFVGALYLDFGPVFTLLLAFVLSQYLLSVYEKPVLQIADIYIYYYFFCFMINGVFVVGRGYYLTILMAFVLYWILKLLTLKR